MNRDERIVVVGGGLTGLRAAERLRELKFEGEITILGDEKLPPYHRPALSKQLLKGELRSSDLTLPAYEDLNARWRFGTQVRQLIPNKKTLLLPGGEEMTYDGLIIATGVEATRQSGVPYHDPRVLVLRTLSDGLDLERVLGSTKGRVAVIGGGFTGCELAASLRHLSREVTLIGRGKNLLGNVLGPDLGEWLTNTHREHGVDLALGNSVEEWNPTSEGIGLKLTDGSTLMVSCVILAAGTKPMTHWLRGSGLPLDNGVVCEPTCHVVGADDVVAAGDVAQWPNLRFDNVPRRVEHWLNAVEMGRAAAENLLAGRENAEPFSPMPRFWTDQYSYRIQAAGMIKLGKDIVKLGTPDEGTGTVYGYSLEGRLMAVSGVDCPTAMISWTESLSRQNPAPKTRVPQEERQPITVGGAPQKRPAGKHVAPPKEKQFPREERRDPEISYVEQPTPVGVGLGAVVPAGRPQNVVDSFSRMLPVAVRQPDAGLPPMNTRPPAARGPVPPARPPVPPPPPIPPAPPSRAMASTGPFPTPAAPAGPRGPINAPFGDGASSSGLFPAVNRPGGGPRNDATPPAGRPALTPPTGRIPAQKPDDRPKEPRFSAAELTDIRSVPERLNSRVNPVDVTGEMAPLDANGNMRAPEFSDRPPRRGAQDSFGAMPPVRGSQDSFSSLPPVRRGANGMPVARGPEDSFGGMPPARGPMDSFSSLPPVRRGTNGMPVARGPEDSFGGLPPARHAADSGRAPAARGPVDSFSSMPPVARGTNGTPVGSEDSFTGLPPARRRTNGTPAARKPEQSFSSMPPVQRDAGRRRATGPEESFTGLPPARRSAGRGPEDSVGGLPPARHDSGRTSRSSEDSFSGLPPVQREAGRRRPLSPEETFSGLPLVPPVRSGSDSGRMPVARGPESSFPSMPPASPAKEGTFGSMPSVRGPNDPFGDPPPRHGADGVSTGGGRRRAPEDSFSTMNLDDGRHGAHRAEDLTPDFGVPGKRRNVSPELSSLKLVPAMSSVDESYDNLTPARMPKHGRPEDYGFVPSTRPGPEDSYDRMPAVDRPAHSSGGRRRARA